MQNFRIGENFPKAQEDDGKKNLKIKGSEAININKMMKKKVKPAHYLKK